MLKKCINKTIFKNQAQINQKKVNNMGVYE